MSKYINEAFKAYRLLESEDFEITPEGLDNLGSFMNQAIEDEAVDVIDLEAETEEELKKSYIGKVICDCNVCHSNIFYDKEDVVIDDDGVVNVDDECPYCMSTDGYTIVGEIAPYSELSIEDEDESEIEDETPDLDVEVEDDIDADEPIEIEESAKTVKGRHLAEELANEYEFTPEEAKKYWEENYDSDPVLMGYDTFEEWYDESVKNGYIKESITESTEKFEIAPSLIKGKTYTCVYEGGGKYKYIGKVEHPEFGEMFKFKPLDNAAKKTTQEVSDEMGLTYDGFAYMSDETVFYTFFDSEDELLESIENVSIDTDDETMTMTTKEDGGIVIETSPIEESDIIDDVEDMPIETEDEMIAPLSDETQIDLGLIDDESEEASEEDIESEETFEEEPVEDAEEEAIDTEESTDEEEIEPEEFDEEEFNDLGESYFRRTYDNVKGFKTTSVTVNENFLTVTGNLSFKSGNIKKTSFVFEAKATKNGKYLFEGYNKEINPGKKAFKLNCSLKGKTLIPESLSYNYMNRNDLNESIQIKGKVKTRRK